MQAHAGFIGVFAGLIVDLVRHNNETGNALGNVYCCLEQEFCRRYNRHPMQFQTAIRYAKRKGWLN